MRNRQHEIQHVSRTMTSFSGLLALYTETFYSTFHATLAGGYQVLSFMSREPNGVVVKG